MPIIKIVSGAQTGADLGGLDCAIHCELPYGGWIPKGRKSEAGPIPEKYLNLNETTSDNYLARTEANVVDSDATVIFTKGILDGGSLKTAQFCDKHGRPHIHIDIEKLSRADVVGLISMWLEKDCPKKCVLNVAGSRESKSPGIQHLVMVRMVDVISKVNGTLFYSLGD